MSPEARALFEELRELIRSWSRHDKTVAGEERAREIGRQLHQLGGEPMMQAAYYYCTMINPAASVLSLLWDDIGGWKW